MPLLTRDEFKASREARDAGVDAAPDADIDAALTDQEQILYDELGYRVDTSITSITVEGNGTDTLRLPERLRTFTAVTQDGTAVAVGQFYRAANGFALKRKLAGYYTAAIPQTFVVGASYQITGTFGFTEDEAWREIAQKVLRLMVAADLRSTRLVGNFPDAPPGALLTGYTSEHASFSFYTPNSEPTGVAEADRLILRIRHPLLTSPPNGKSKRLHSVPMVPAPSRHAIGLPTP